MTPTRQLPAARQRAAVSPAAVNLPKSQATKNLTDDELAVVARLIRVMRQKTCWLGAFIESLLEKDSDVIGWVSFEQAEQLLHDIKGLNSWASWFEQSPLERATILKYFGHRFFPDRVDRLIDDVCGGDDPEFCDLVKIWRMEHPEPAQPRQVPSGFLGRKDPDDDE